MTRLSEHLPWATFEAPGVVACWDGSYMRSYRFTGPNITSASKAERVHIAERLNSVLGKKSARWTWHCEEQFRKVQRYQQSQWPTAASMLLDVEREYGCRRQFELRQYLTLTEAPMQSLAVMGKGFVTQRTLAERDEQRDDFRRACDEVANSLRGVAQLEELSDDETATYLNTTISPDDQLVSAESVDIISECLGNASVTRGIRLAKFGDAYMAVMTLGGFPKKSHPQMIDELGLTKLGFEYRRVIRWISMERGHAKALMARRELKALGQLKYSQDVALNQLQAKDKDGLIPQREDREQRALADDAGEAMTRLSTRGHGHLAVTFIVWDRSLQRCRDNAARLKNQLEQQNGLVVRDETFEQMKPWRMSLPGNREHGRRMHPMSTRNLADMMPSSSPWIGRDCDAELAKVTGVRRSWMYTADPIGFGVNSDVPGGGAHMLLMGATGQAGKSTIANHFGIQMLGWPNAQVISLSIGRSELGPVILNGGAVYSVGRPDSLAFQPLAFVNEPEEARAALEWLQLCLETLGERVSPEDTEALQEGIHWMAPDAQERRTMTSLVGFLSSRAPKLALALAPYASGGHYAAIFDGSNADAVKRHRWTMFDISKLLDMSSAATVPAIAHLLHRVRRWFDGRPTLLLLDEFPNWLHHAQLERFVIRVLDTNRKDQVRVLMAGQSPGQLTQYPRLLASVKSGCATQIFGPDTKARAAAAAYADLDVTPVEIDRIANPAEMQIGTYLLKNGYYGSRVFSLNAGPIALAFTGMSRPDELGLLEDLHRRFPDPEAAMNELLRIKNLDKRAKELMTWKNRQNFGRYESIAAERC